MFYCSVFSGMIFSIFVELLLFMLYLYTNKSSSSSFGYTQSRTKLYSKHVTYASDVHTMYTMYTVYIFNIYRYLFFVQHSQILIIDLSKSTLS